MTDLYWVGSRESDIKYTNHLFAGSICLYGEGAYSLCKESGLRIDNNAPTPERDAFILKSIRDILSKNPQAKFCFYDPSWIYEIDGLQVYRNSFICVNNKSLYELFNDKINFYNAAKDIAPLVYSSVLTNDKDFFGNCKKVFSEKTDKYIVHCPISNGGNGTFLLTSRSKDRIEKKLTQGARYLVSEYFENSIPVNIHFIITDKELIRLPGSVQIIRQEADLLRYCGADYDTYQRIRTDLRSAFEEYAERICLLAQAKGYRGICGLDGIIVEDKIFINEFNARFQASGTILNMCLTNEGLPCLQELNLLAFENKAIPDTDRISAVSTPYSMYIFYNHKKQLFADHILENAAKEPYVTSIDTDGYSKGISVDHNIYMFRIIIRENISSVNADGGVYLHENLVEPDYRLYTKVMHNDPLAVKLTLMTLGVKLTPRTEKYLLKNGGIRPGNNNAVDMNVLQMVVNAPRDIKFIALSPYTIKLGKDHVLKLYYYNHFVADTKLYPLDPLGQKITSRGVPYGTVAYLSTDRLRVHMTHECIFKRYHTACKFCNIVPCKDAIQLADLREVIHDYVANSPAVRHFLVGGQSMNQKEGMERIVEICKMIREVTADKHIYVMALPYTKQAIKELVDAGMNEIACNIEIFDPELAKRYMPGKGAISRNTYFRILSYAKTLLPENGAVRSMLIYGLEPKSSFLKGIKKLTKLGIQPIISIFRPLPDTELEKFVAPPLMDVYDLYYRAEKICQKHELHLGPSCVFCQNNTLSLPEEYVDLTL